MEQVKTVCKYLVHLSFRTHLLISVLLRLILIYYGQFHDKRSEVPYTDIDYKVVTDGARCIIEGHSPFDRHTYRYSPILAYIQIPNIWINMSCGKIIYATFDIIVALLIYAVVLGELQTQRSKAINTIIYKYGKIRSKFHTDVNQLNLPEMAARASACFWLYNPLTAVISTRGNGDSFSSFFVILTIYFLSKSEFVKQGRNWFIFAAGLSHGLAIHLRLYPLLFSLAYYLCLSERVTCSLRSFLMKILFPSYKQLILILGTLLSLCVVTGFFYQLYGWQYIYEAYVYHFVRKDVRHNFSIYFLMQYLGSSIVNTALTEKLLILAPQLLLLLYVTLSFGQFRQTLPFCIFLLSFVMVTFNSVVTSQYFIWYMALLPLCLYNFPSITMYKAILMFSLWLMAQALWLIPAYLLEFKTWNTFFWIGAQSAVFFIVNNLLLVQLIEHYSFTSFKFNLKKL